MEVCVTCVLSCLAGLVFKFKDFDTRLLVVGNKQRDVDDDEKYDDGEHLCNSSAFNPLSPAVLFLLSFFEKSPIQTLDAYIS